jgi:hypothetical protein
MIKCKFQYLNSTGFASDSLIDEINISILPRIGELIFINNGSKHKIVDIIHEIDTANGEHIATIQHMEVN